MENPKTMETLEVESPCEEIPKEASVMSDIFSGLDFVSEIPDGFGDDENAPVKALVAEAEKAEDSPIIEAEQTQEKGNLVNVEDHEAEAAKAEDSPKFEAEQTQEKGSLVIAEEHEAEAAKAEDSPKFVAEHTQEKDSLVNMEEREALPGFQESTIVENMEVETPIAGSDVEDSEKLGVKEEWKPEEKNASVKVNDLALGEEEAPIEGISLYVDIHGSPTIEDRASDFSVGDIVWAKSKNQKWWPGKIHNPAKAPKYALRVGPGDDILVGFYGTGQFAWFARPKLKPFHEAFDKVMTGKKRKNKSELVFLVAVAKASEEFGALVKSEMTCSCRSKRGREDLGKKRLGEFSAADFEPASFLGRLKCFALFESAARAIDASVARNRLSAFFRSLGHMQLPPYRLTDKKSAEEEESSPQKSKKNGSGDGFVSAGGSRKRKTKKDSEVNEVEESTPRDKGFESRERKKSKYLSYPYVNFVNKAEIGRVETGASQKSTREDVLASPLIPKNTGEKFWRKWYLQVGAKSDEPEGSETANLASSDLLDVLLCAAVNGLSSDGFGSVGLFLSKYRVSVYSDESAVEICPKNVLAQNEATESKFKRKSDKKRRNSTKSSAGDLNIDNGTESGVLKTKPLSVPEENGSKRRSTKKKKSNPAKGSVNSEVANESLEGALELSNGKTKLNKATEEKDKPKKKSYKKTPGKSLGSTKTEPSLAGDKTPEENKRKSAKKKENSMKNESENLEATLGTAMPQTDPVDMKMKSLSGLSDVKIISAGIGVSVKEALEKNRLLSHCKKAEHKIKKKKESSAEKTPIAIPDLNAISSKPELSKDPNVVIDAKPGNLVVDLHSPINPNGQTVSESAPKKRKRKEKKNSPENIPDLNGTKEEPEQKKKKKPKRKDKIEVVLKYPKNKSLAGSTTLLLTFAPGEGSAPAAAEDLASAFRKFGPLKESETRVSKDPNDARVVFENASDASEALRSLERDNPFGPGLVSFRLLTPAPQLEFIKQNLQMMTDMLEKSGDNLSQEMRAKLEEEIKGLLSKVSSMAGT